MATSKKAYQQLNTGDALTIYPTEDRATFSHFEHDLNVVFIHGFTSHGSYMTPLMEYFSQSMFRAFAFNYNSFRGIREAARTLFEIIRDLDQLGNGVIAQRKLSIVAHSMGGLVARAFLRIPSAPSFCKRVVALGTPHDGTLKNDRLLKVLVRWGEHVTETLPGATNLSSQTSKEMLGIDHVDPKRTLLEELKGPEPGSASIPILSVSGGRTWLEFSRNPVTNLIFVSPGFKGQQFHRDPGAARIDLLHGQIDPVVGFSSFIFADMHSDAYGAGHSEIHEYALGDTLAHSNISDRLRSGSTDSARAGHGFHQLSVFPPN